MVPSLSPPSLLLLATFIGTSLQQNCYFPNGVIARNDYPCTSLISKSPGTDIHCCEVGRTCLPNRMCSGNSQHENPMRGTCTDSTWNSPNCPKFYTPYSRLGKMYNCTSSGGVVGQNNDPAFCCVDTGPNCCNYQSLLFVANNWDFVASASFAETRGTATSLTSSSTLTSTSTSSSSSSSSGLTTSSSSSSAITLASSVSASPIGVSKVTITEGNTETPTTLVPTIAAASSKTTTPENSPEGKRDWTGIGIGAGVGAAVPLLALIAVGIFLWRRHRRRREMYELPPMDSYTRDSASTKITKEASVLSTKPVYLKRYEADGAQTYELDSVAEKVELPLKSPRELPGSEGERQRYQTYQSTTGY